MTDFLDERLAIGRIRTSHGLGGDLRVASYSGETDHFSTLKEVELRHGDRRKTFAVERVRATAGHLLVKLAGIDSPEEAKGYSGWEIVVEREAAAPLGENEYYLSDLCKCDVVKRGRRLGSILSVCEGGGGDMLEVQVPSGKRFFVPFRNEFVGKVDIAKRTVEIEADWLLE